MNLENLRPPTAKEPRVKRGDWLPVSPSHSVQLTSHPQPMTNGEKWWATVEDPARKGHSKVIFFTETEVWL